MYKIKLNNLESIIHIHVFFPSSLHICLLTHEAACEATSPPLKMNAICRPIHTDTCVYIFFIEACFCMTAVSLDHLCALCMIVPVFLLLWSEAA